MTVPFYSQAELDAAIAKERLWIRDACNAEAATWRVDEMNLRADLLERLGHRIAAGDYPRPLMVEPEVPDGG